MPFVMPATVQAVVAVVQAAPPGDAVAVYPVIAEPPVDAGAVQLTADWLSATVAVVPVGAPGAAIGVTDAELDSGPVPTEFVAVTLTV
jgi:hypothetical protein